MKHEKALYLDAYESGPEVEKAILEASVVFMNGVMIKNRSGNLAAPELSEADKAARRELHIRLLCGALSGPRLVTDDDDHHPVNCIDTIAQCCADGVDQVYQIWKERGLI